MFIFLTKRKFSYQNRLLWHPAGDVKALKLKPMARIRKPSSNSGVNVLWMNIGCMLYFRTSGNWNGGKSIFRTLFTFFSSGENQTGNLDLSYVTAENSKQGELYEDKEPQHHILLFSFLHEQGSFNTENSHCICNHD